MSSQKLSMLAAQIDSFPVLPTVVSHVMQITADPDSSQKDLIKVITPDQSLTSTILKMSNSAFYGLMREVSTLQQALTILGFAEIRNLVLTKAVFNSFKTLKKNDKWDIKEFWEHSFFCGLAAKIIGTELKVSKNELFTAGLIHDLGKLVIYMATPDDFFKIIEEAESTKVGTYLAEKNILGTTHDEVGIGLVKKWMFPEPLMAAVEFHHHPLDAKKHTDFSFIIHVADLLAHLSISKKDEDDTALCKEEIYASIIALSESYGVKWNESDLLRFQEKLADLKEEESATLALFV